MLLPILIKSFSFNSKSENLKISKGKTNKQTFKQKLRVVSLFGEKIAYRLLQGGGGGGLVTAFDIAAFGLSMIAPVKN